MVYTVTKGSNGENRRLIRNWPLFDKILLTILAILMALAVVLMGYWWHGFMEYEASLTVKIKRSVRDENHNGVPDIVEPDIVEPDWLSNHTP